MLCVNGKVDESRQIHLLIFRENSNRMMRELGSGYGSPIIKEIGLTQLGAIELQLWVTN
jgi:hypothetical protein